MSGKTKEFLFSPSESAGEIAKIVFEQWPEGEWTLTDNESDRKQTNKYFFCFTLDWESEAVDKAEILRLIYQGRFLHCNVTLGALGLPLGKTTVMHLVPRDNLPEPNSQGKSNSIFSPSIFRFLLNIKHFQESSPSLPTQIRFREAS